MQIFNVHPDRDAQFRYLNEQARNHQDGGAPVISVDTKKKELVGPFENNGREGEPRAEPVRGDTHDFPDRELGRAVPYGIYDVAANTGWVNVGTDHDTAAFAVGSIRRWWNGGRTARGDPQQALGLVVIDLADAYSFCHPDSLAGRRLPDQEATSIGQPAVGLCGAGARVNPWLRSTFATCSV